MAVKKYIVGVAMALIMVYVVIAAGWDDYGYNTNARTFKGWYNFQYKTTSLGTGDAWLIMKWYNNWDIYSSEQLVGAVLTKDYVYYTNDYATPDYGWSQRLPWTDYRNPPTASYMVTREQYIVKADFNEALWQEYSALGAYAYDNRYYDPGVVPRYWVLQDAVNVYDGPGKPIASYQIADAPIR